MITRITDIEDPRVQVFSRLTEAQLRNRLDPSRGVFIAESPKVIRVALDAGYQPLSLLCEEKHIVGDAHDIVARLQEQGAEIYTGSRELLASLTGYTLTRGVLCAMRRPVESSVENVVDKAHRVVVIDGVVDATNIGAIFRSAAALGIDAVLVTRSSCDPWNRRAIRVSMGSVFLVPWTWLEDYSQLREQGFATCAMALDDRSIGIDDPILHAQERLAIIMGTEGEGLPDETIKAADYVVKIPMAHGVDSLNVAAAASVAFWELRKRG
ncbi:MAG: RNA methyltransferase [Bacteroidaceae bacterium]|nr:RNA methyltransferase [Bacteroidaceae bacterium]